MLNFKGTKNIMSDSDSEIDEPKPTRRKIIKKHFSSDSDDSEMSPQPGCSRRNRTKQLSSSDCETDDSDLFNSDERGVNAERKSKLKKFARKIMVNDDAGSSEICPICLLSLQNQEIGIPEMCEHKFCFSCIQELSNYVTTCPVDRKGYTKIIVKDNIRDFNTLRSVPVKVKSTIIDVFEEDLTQCEVCNQVDGEDSMLLCDNCNNGYHMDCLNPPLEEVPFGSWYCDCCFSRHNSEESEDDINDLMKSDELKPDIPEDLYYWIKKVVAIRKNLERNRKDIDSRFSLIFVESRINRLARYYKTKSVLPPNWKYESSTNTSKK